MPLTDRLEVLPVVMERLVWLRERLISTTLILHSAVRVSSPVPTVAVMVQKLPTFALEGTRTVTVVPAASTVAREVLLLNQVTV